MAQSEKYIVVDIGGTKIRWALWQGSDLEAMDSCATPKVAPREFITNLQSQLRPLLEKHDIKGVGVSTAGPVDVMRGTIMNPANLGNDDPGWMRFNLQEDLSAALKVPVNVDNDAAMTAFGQYCHFEKKKVQDLVVITLGTGLGVGALVDGRLVRAGQGMHPELGHLLIGDQPSEDYTTPFANYPTMETFLSGYHFSQRVGQALGRLLEGAELIQLSKNEDPKVIPFWETYSRKMALALSNLYLIYFPQKIVFAGGFAMVSSPFFLAKTQESLREILQGRVEAGMPLPDIEISANHDDLPLLGAAYKIQQS